MSSKTGRSRARRLQDARRARGWPFCEHCGSERITGTAAVLVVEARRALGAPWASVIVDGIQSLAAETPPEAVLGVCPGCGCMTTRDAIPHQ